MRNIYLASPFFNEKQNENLKKVVKALEANETIGNIFLPGNYQHEELEFGTKEWKNLVFEQDVTNIDNCDIVVAVADFLEHDGELISDPGTIWEMGYAKGTNKPVFLVDVSNAYKRGIGLNLMIDMGTQVHLALDELEKFDFNNIVIKRKDWKAI